MITKKKVLIVSLAYLAVCVAIIVFFKYFLGCQWRGECVNLGSTGTLIFSIFFWPMPIFLIVFIFSLLTYKMHEAVFIAWRKFAIWALPLLILLSVLLIAGSSAGGMGIGSAIAASFTIMMLLLLFSAFIIISLIIIAWKYFTTRSR